MIIISQDKRILYPFNNAISVVPETGLIVGERKPVSHHLGVYENEKRAKEVLQDIIKNYQRKFDVYPMPKE